MEYKAYTTQLCPTHISPSSLTGRGARKHAVRARVLEARAAGTHVFVTINVADLVVATRARVARVCTRVVEMASECATRLRRNKRRIAVANRKG